MKDIIEMMRTDTFLIILTCLVILLVIGFITMIVKLSSLNKKYREFMKKVGNGNSNIC